MKLAKLQVLPKDPIDPSDLWRSILAYVNGDNAPEDFRSLAVQCFEQMGVENGEEVLQACRDMKRKPTLSALEDRYRDDFKGVLYWLTRPDPVMLSPTQAELDDRFEDINRADFLFRHSQGVKVQLAVVVSLDPETQAVSTHIARTVQESSSVVDGICRFIMDQVDRHDVGGEPLAKVVPVGLCERDSCGRFFYVERVGRGRFCSDKCRAMVASSKMTKEDKAARMARYRAGLKAREKAELEAVMGKAKTAKVKV